MVLTRIRKAARKGTGYVGALPDRRSAKRAPRMTAPPVPLDCEAITGSQTWGVGEMWCWYRLDPKRWSLLGHTQRTAVLEDAARKLAELAPTRIQYRGTTRPYPASAWRRALHARTPHPLPDAPGGVSNNEWLARQEQRLASALLADKIDLLGVRIVDGLSAVEMHALRTGDADKTLTHRVRDRLLAVTEIMAGPGLDAREAPAKDVEYVIHRSAALGVAAAPPTVHLGDVWEPGDMAAFTDPVTPVCEPNGRIVRLDVERDGLVTSSYVTVVTCGRIGRLLTPEDGQTPFLAHADELPFPVEVGYTMDLVPGEAVLEEFSRQIVTGTSQAAHYRQHEEPGNIDTVPPSISRHIAAASAKADEVEHGPETYRPRAIGLIHFAVYATTPEECSRRARALVAHYRRRATLHIATGQYDALRSLIPHQRPREHGFVRQMPVRMLAFMQPQTTSRVGDGKGCYKGYTVSTSRKAWMVDGHYATSYMGKSGLTLIAAGLGAGKTVLAGSLLDDEVRRGHRCVAVDWSGPLARMKQLPHLAEHTTVMNLTSAPAGALNPYPLVPDPSPVGLSDAEYREAMGLAEAERLGLVTDVTWMLVAGDLAKITGVRTTISNAVGAAGGSADKTLWDVIAVLEKWSIPTPERPADPWAGSIAESLRTTARLPMSRLFFPPLGENGLAAVTDAMAGLYENLLTIITMPGLKFPDGNIPREEWSSSERLAFPLLHCATYFATRVVYSKPREEPVTIFIDEAHILSEWGSGRAFYTRLSRDSRKHNAWVIAASQNPAADEAAFGEDVEEFGVNVMIGHLESDKAIAAAIKLLRVAPGCGYEALFARLPIDPKIPYRDWIVRDTDGNVEQARHDLSWYPELLAVLLTNPEVDGGAAAWELNDDLVGVG